MKRSAARYEIKAGRWEYAARVVAYAAVFGAAAIFVFMIFRAGHLIERYQPAIDPFSYAETHLYVLLVEVALWMIIAKAAIRFKAYAWRIRGSSDGAALNLMANAMLLSFGSAILFDMASTFKTMFMGTALLPNVTTVTNLLPLAVFLLLSVLLYAGSVRLVRLVPSAKGLGQRYRRLVACSLGLFVLLIIPFGGYFYHVAPLIIDDDGLRHFVLPANVLVGIYLVPFIAIWLLGVLSCVNLATYALRVQGKIYRRYFFTLSTGILIAYISSYLIQIFYVSNLPSNQFGFGLVFILSLIVMLIVGYGLMYRGANQLYMLERGPSK